MPPSSGTWPRQVTKDKTYAGGKVDAVDEAKNLHQLRLCTLKFIEAKYFSCKIEIDFECNRALNFVL